MAVLWLVWKGNSMFYFQKLEIYQLSKGLVVEVYEITSRMPQVEKFTLVQQLNRAAISIPSNIAEGVTRRSQQEKIRFINIAQSSLMEAVCQIEIAKELGYITNTKKTELINKAHQLAVKISNYEKYLTTKLPTKD